MRRNKPSVCHMWKGTTRVNGFFCLTCRLFGEWKKFGRVEGQWMCPLYAYKEYQRYEDARKEGPCVGVSKRRDC
jgi:hypothetical protein